MPPVTISFSEISTWKSCRMKWYWRYDQRLEPKRSVPYLTMGTLCHTGVEAWLRGEDISDKVTAKAAEYITEEMFEEECSEVVKQAELAIAVVERYVHNQLEFYFSEIKALEQNFLVRIPRTLNLVHGRFDAIVEKDQRYWLVEWKFPRAFRSEEDIQLSTQLAVYQWAALKLGYPVIGILYNQILPKLPAIPKQNKDGTTSKMEIYTDWQTYSATVRERGGDPNHYREEMEPKLVDKEFWRQYRIYRTPKQVEAYIKELRDVAFDIASTRKKIYMCESSITCSGCPYKEICVEKAKGNDPQSMIEAAYQTRKQNHDTNTVEV